VTWDIRFDLGAFGTGQMSAHARIDAVAQLVEALVYVNRLWLPFHRGTPPLYKSGVVFQADDAAYVAGEPNWWRDIPQTIALGYGHCVALTAWRLAELQEGGERAKVRIFEWHMPDGGVDFHIHVLRGDGKTVEDPAKILGMP
jgi:hypothetical protein